MSICFPTIDPRNGGGVLSVLEAANKAAKEEEIEHSIAYNAREWKDCYTLVGFFKGKGMPSISVECSESIEGYKIPRVLPELESVSYISNYNYWKQIVQEFDVFFGVGGSCLPCLPLALEGKSYSVWVGTTFFDEREVQSSKFNNLRMARNIIEEPILSQMEKYVFKNCSKIYAQSSYTRSRISDLYHISASKIDLLPYPIDTEKFSDGGSTAEDEIVFVGRFSDPRKNIKLLLESFSLLGNGIEPKLTLIGDELSQSEIRHIEKLGIEDKVTNPGRVSDLRPYLQRAKIFALPSHQEGLGIAGLEAMSCGTPVVSTKCGGPEDYIISGHNGFLVPKGDKYAFSDAMEEIIADNDLYHKMSRQCRRYIKSNFSEEIVLPQVKEALQNAGE